MAEANIIQEGFLCPICLKDLRSPKQLIAHFEDLHSEEQDILTSIKDFCGKATKKILKLDDKDLEKFKNDLRIENLTVKISEPQPPGHFNTHTDFFRTVRRERLDHKTAETNKLIIRLDKLLRLEKADRRHQEQVLVAWLDGTTVTRCPSCAASFNITRRQHHCRLCGSIMCHDCSIFLSFERAQSIVVPIQNLGSSNKEGMYGRENDNFRICSHCSGRLEHRRMLQVEQMMQPIISQLYAHLQKLKHEVQSQVDLYQEMFESLVGGEKKYHLQDAQTLKASIGKKAETIDTISKKISSLSLEPYSPQVETLKMNIRRATSNYIKDYLLTLPPLPSNEEIEARRNNLEKLSREENYHSLRDIPKSRIRRVVVTTGWTPPTFESSSQSDSDPIIEQMNNVRFFIEQARKDERFEEVVSLEENLRMLKEEYERNHKSKRDN